MRDLQQIQRTQEAVKVTMRKSLVDVDYLRYNLLHAALPIGKGTFSSVYALEGWDEGVVLLISKYQGTKMRELGHMLVQDPRTKYNKYEATLSADQVTDYRYASLLMQDPSVIKVNFGKLTNTLIMNNICPHYVFLYKHTNWIDFDSSVVDYKKPSSNITNRYDNITFLERFESSLFTSLVQHQHTTAIINRPEQLMSVIFQVASAVATLQHYAPGFRHNDLWTTNILIRTHKAKKDEITIYKCAGKTYRLLNIGVTAAIADFDLAHAPCAIVYSDLNDHNIKQKTMSVAKDAQFLNMFILSSQHFDNKEANEKLSDSENTSFDMFMFLKNIYKTINTSSNSVRFSIVLKFIRNVFGEASKLLDDDSKYHPNDKAIPNLDPFRIMDDETFQSMGLIIKEEEEEEQRHKVIAQYAFKPINLVMRYVGTTAHLSQNLAKTNRPRSNVVTSIPVHSDTKRVNLSEVYPNYTDFVYF